MVSATAMLLVAAILMVSSTYAWFTLSTAPEVTGITTQVGANGNLEIALLNSETMQDLSKIQSAVGNSSAASGVTVAQANVTWGNIVDLSGDEYGLSSVTLQPATLNGTFPTSVTNVAAPLQTPEYGADGRVSELKAAVSAQKSDDGFVWSDGNQSYGARVVGSASSATAQSIGLAGAKTSYSSYMRQAANTAQNALTANVTGLISLATAEESTDITAQQVTSLYNVALGLQNALSYVEKAYRQAAIAYIASTVTDEEAYNTAVAAVNAATLEQLTSNEKVPTEIKTELGYLKNAQANAKASVDALAAYTGTGAKGSEIKAAGRNILNNTAYNKEGTYVTVQNKSTTAATNNSCVMADVADYVGEYSFLIDGVGGVTVKPSDSAGENGKLSAKAGTVNGYSAAGAEASVSRITDTYGYIVDLAVRTNAASSNLLLQTDATQRVYNDSTSAATQGLGSSLKFSYAASMTTEQVTTLMNALRVVFLNPDSGDIYAVAVAGDIDFTTTAYEADAELRVLDKIADVTYTTITLGKDAYTEVSGQSGFYQLNTANYPEATATTTYTNYSTELIGQEQYDKLEANTKTVTTVAKENLVKDKNAVITALEQNTAKKISVLVYLDGTLVDNSAVAYDAVSSGALNLNLQFSSSADLQPMNNTSLRAIESEATVGNGAKITGATYTYAGESISLTAALTESTENIREVVWSVADTQIATISGTGTTGTVTAKAVGTTDVAAIIITEKNNMYVASYKINVLASDDKDFVTMQNATKTSQYDPIETLMLSTSSTANEVPQSATLGVKLSSLNNVEDGLTGNIRWKSSDDTKVKLDGEGNVIADSNGYIVADTMKITQVAETTDPVKITVQIATKKITTDGADKGKPDFENGVVTLELPVSVTTPADKAVTDIDNTDGAASVTLYGAGTKGATLSLKNVKDGVASDSSDTIKRVIVASSNRTYATASVSGSTVTITGQNVAGSNQKVLALVYTTNGGILTKVIDFSVVMPTLSLSSSMDVDGNLLSATISSDSGEISNVSWTSSNTEVATISNGTTSSATVNGLKDGETTITAVVTYEGGGTATVSQTITVKYHTPAAQTTTENSDESV
jgi:hypothetical protein